MIRPKTGKFLAERLVDRRGRTYDILRQLGGNIHLVAALIFVEYPAEAFLTAGIHIGGIKIIDALLDRKEHFPLRFLVVDDAAFPAEPHAAVTDVICCEL